MQRDSGHNSTNFAYLMNKNKSFARTSRAYFFLFLFISFLFYANLYREMTFSQVLQRTRTHSREFEFPSLDLTSHL